MRPLDPELTTPRRILCPIKYYCIHVTFATRMISARATKPRQTCWPIKDRHFIHATFATHLKNPTKHFIRVWKHMWKISYVYVLVRVLNHMRMKSYTFAGCPATSFFLLFPFFSSFSHYFLFFPFLLLKPPINSFFWGMQKKKKKCTWNMRLPHNMCIMIIACALKKIIFNGYDHPLR